MEYETIRKIKLRVEAADKSATRLRSCKDHRDFVLEWHTFLVLWSGVYSIVEKYIESGPKEDRETRENHFNRPKQAINSNPKLSYLYHARNHSEHSLHEPYAVHPGSAVIGVQSMLPEGVDGSDVTISFSTDEFGVATFHSPIPDNSIVTPPSVSLSDIKTKSGATIIVPWAKGKRPKVKCNPYELSETGMVFVKDILARAERFI